MNMFPQPLASGSISPGFWDVQEGGVVTQTCQNSHSPVPASCGSCGRACFPSLVGGLSIGLLDDSHVYRALTAP